MRKLRFVTTALAAVGAALLIAPAGVATASTPSPVPTGFQPASTSWLTAQRGYVFGYAACSWSDSCEFLFDTNNGGTTWQQLTAPPIGLPANSNHVALTFASAKVGFATDGEYLYATRDGAQHWSTVSLAGLNPTRQIDISSVTVFNGKVFAVGTDNGDADPVKIYSAALTADTLQPVARLALTGLPYDYAQITSVGGVLQVAAGAIYHTERYWISHDGTTFAGAPVPCPPNTSTPSLSGVRAGHVLVICAADPADPQPGEQEKQLFVAPALGKPFAAASPLPVVGYQQDFATASAQNASAATQAGGVNQIYATFDAGKTWRTTLTVDDLPGLWDLAFPGADTGYLVAGLPQSPVGASQLYRSTDAGHTWSVLAIK
ncbi:MAG TPA: hypothetical protein VGM75_26365 [Pseudonocardiaceae bacterium]